MAANPNLLAAVSALILQQSMTPPAAPPAQITAAATTVVWQQHRTDQGRIFWHNTKTNKSTWDKPDELRTDVERILATSTSWREYPGGEGQPETYWHNLDTKQSEWQCPAEVATALAKIEELKNEDWSSREFNGKTEAKKEFRIFLERYGIGHKGKWEEVGKILQADPKWKCFDKWMTAGERKHIFTELVNQLQKKVKEEQRVKKAQARDELTDYLLKWKNGENGHSPMPPDATYDDFDAKAQNEPWFYLLEPADKAEAFEETAQNVLNQMGSGDTACFDELVQFFKDMQFETSQMPLSMPIEEVMKTVRLYFDEKFMIRATPLLILTAWQQFVKSHLSMTIERARVALAREERLNREAFRDALLQAEDEGLLNAKTEWRDFLHGPAPLKVVQVTASGGASTGTIAENMSDRNHSSEMTSRKHKLMDEGPPSAEPRDRDPSAIAKLEVEMADHVEPSNRDSASAEGHESAAEEGEVDSDTIVPMEEGKSTSSIPLQAEKAELLSKIRDKVNEWMIEERRSTEEGSAMLAMYPERLRMCETDAYLKMFLQGGSTARELFEDHVYHLWDIYESLRMRLRKSCTRSSPFGAAVLRWGPRADTSEKLAALTEAAKAELVSATEGIERKGVLLPLVESFHKRLLDDSGEPTMA